MSAVDIELEKRIKEDNIKVHALESAVYDKIHPEDFNFYQTGRLDALAEYIRSMLPERARILDVGCGMGRVSSKFTGKGYSLTCVDISREMLDRFQSELTGYPAGDVEFIVEDGVSFLRNLDGDGKFDLVVMSAFLHHLPDIDETVGMAAGAVEKGGTVFVFQEPIKQPITGRLAYILHRAIAVLDESCYRMSMLLKGIDLGKFDYKYSDYQRTLGGIQAERVETLLVDKGLTIKKLARYTVRRYGIFAMISNGLLKNSNTFDIIARREN